MIEQCLTGKMSESCYLILELVNMRLFFPCFIIFFSLKELHLAVPSLDIISADKFCLP